MGLHLYEKDVKARESSLSTHVHIMKNLPQPVLRQVGQSHHFLDTTAPHFGVNTSTSILVYSKIHANPK